MIFRRRRTANFTTIGNELFEDHRLALDEIGILAWLLSRPDDWEVRRPALMRRHKIGRDGLRRIIRNLMKTGWCHAQKTRLGNGTFYVVYEIRDEPGPTLSEDEVREALSLVSSEAGETNSEDDGASDQLRDSDSPDAPRPPVAGPEVAGRSWPYKSLPNTDSPNTDSTQEDGGAIWADLQKAWPPDDILSPLVCEKIFAALSQKDRQQAIEAAAPYLASCRAKNRKICDLSTYLKERRFERFEAAPANVLWQTKPGTPQAKRWLESGQLTAFQAEQLSRGRPITTPTEFPKSTGPPRDSELMTSEDEQELAKKWG